MKRPVEVKFYDGILAEARRAWIVPDQQQGIVLKLDEDIPAQVSDADFYFAYPDMAYIGGPTAIFCSYKVFNRVCCSAGSVLGWVWAINCCSVRLPTSTRVCSGRSFASCLAL
jgi:hypothetical protein